MNPDHLAKFCSLVNDIRECMLVTDDPEIGLRSRPMALSRCDDDGKLWFFTKLLSDKVSEIYHERTVNCAFMRPGDNQYVSATGPAKIVDDPTMKRELYSPLLDAWYDGPDDPLAVLLCVRTEHAEYWDDSDSKLVSFAKIAAAAVTGQEYQGAENEKLELT